MKQSDKDQFEVLRKINKIWYYSERTLVLFYFRKDKLLFECFKR